ncbi:MAG: macro domain-containing protein [Nitrososphaerota archaeon]|nr:macro domain-containing protein [Candidatus Calditenuis fumarioli]
MREFDARGIKLRLYTGDITVETSDAIVVPANSLMVMGGGVAGAVKRAGGSSIEQEARSKAPVEVGRAVVTSAGRLRCRYVIHSPTMERPSGETSPEKVYRATLAALRAAASVGARSVSFPGMGTGVGGLDPVVAGRMMARAVLDFAEERTSGPEVVNFVALNEDLLKGLLEGVEQEWRSRSTG